MVISSDDSFGRKKYPILIESTLFVYLNAFLHKEAILAAVPTPLPGVTFVWALTSGLRLLSMRVRP